MKYGVVDLGSNTVRLAVFDCGAGASRRLFSRQKNVGLASYVVQGALSDRGVLAAAAALTEEQALTAAMGAQGPLVFATASLRNISNTVQVVSALRAATGLEVEVLSGQSEARLSFLGTLSSSPLTSGLLADIGGGSTELVTFQNRTMGSASSLPFGSLSLFKGHISGLFPTEEEGQTLWRMALQAAEQARGDGPPCPALLGAGGTIESAARLAVPVFGRVEPGLTADEAARLLALLRGGGREALLAILQTVPERIHTLTPGLILLNAILKVYGAERVYLSDTDIRDGYLAQYLDRGD